MKCQKCAKLAVVHLTEIIRETGSAPRAVEIHLCMEHAVEAGLLAPGPQVIPPQAFSPQPTTAPKTADALEAPKSIVPASGGGGGLTLARGREEAPVCPVCGLTWSNFRQTGLMGCAHDYQLFEAKLSPLLKRAQEGGHEHVGKVPKKKQTRESTRQAATLRLRRELQRAIDAENYEQAARVRDQLRDLETS